MTHDATDLLAVEQRHRDAAAACYQALLSRVQGDDDADSVAEIIAQFEADLAVTNAQQAATIAAMREALEGLTACFNDKGYHICLIQGGSLDQIAAVERARAALALAQQKDQDNER